MAEGTETKNWTENLQGEQYTPEIKEGLSKFKNQDDVNVGYVNLQKQVGKPFKLPESLDKLPDDKTRGEFTANTLKLLGAVDKEEALDDLDYKVGLPEDREVDTALVGRLKKFAVIEKIPKSIVQKFVGLHNIINEEVRQSIQTQYNEKCIKANEALLATYNNDEKEVAKKSELVRRMFQNNLGLTADEYEEARNGLVDTGFTINPILNKALIAAAEKLATEGTTETGEGAGKEKEELSQYEKNKQRWPNTPELWGPKDK